MTRYAKGSYTRTDSHSTLKLALLVIFMGLVQIDLGVRVGAGAQLKGFCCSARMVNTSNLTQKITAAL